MIFVNIFSAVERTDPSPAGHRESHSQFIDRVAGHYWDQVRDLIEEWFSRLCPDAQADVRGRLRSRDDRQSKGAFFELYLHECLLRMGYAVTCHPEVDGTSRRPDFLAEKDGSAVYVEARSASPSDIVVGAAARVNTLCESLDKIDSPNFFLWIDVDRQGSSLLRARPLRSELQEWLRELNPDAYEDRGNGRRDFPGLSYEANGWRIRFPKSPEARGKDGVRPLRIFSGGQAFVGQDQEGIRNALSDKGSAYGPLAAPYVVAVASGSMSTDDYDVKNALYGTEALLVPTGPGGETCPAALVRSPDGYWRKGDHWAHRHVSAVLVVKQLHPAFVGAQQHTIWEHPTLSGRCPRSRCGGGRQSTPTPQCISSILRTHRRSGSALRNRGRSGSPSRGRADCRRATLVSQPTPTGSGNQLGRAGSWPWPTSIRKPWSSRKEPPPWASVSD